MALTCGGAPTRPAPATAPNRVVAAVLSSRAHRLLSGSLLLLTYTGRRTGTRRQLPVQYAAYHGRLVVAAADPDRKSWWRNFGDPAPVTVTLRGEHVPATASFLSADGPDRAPAAAAYQRRFKYAPIGDATPVLLITPHVPHDSPGGGPSRALRRRSAPKKDRSTGDTAHDHAARGRRVGGGVAMIARR